MSSKLFISENTPEVKRALPKTQGIKLCKCGGIKESLLSLFFQRGENIKKGFLEYSPLSWGVKPPLSKIKIPAKY